MKAEKTEAFVPTGVLDNWNTMDVNEKVYFLTTPSSETIEALLMNQPGTPVIGDNSVIKPCICTES